MIKFAVVGAGFIGGVHCDRLSQIPGAEIAWVIDKDVKKAKKIATNIKAKISCNIDDMLKDKSVDAVIHALPTFERFSFLEKYTKSGKHIFCEKPLARTIEEGEKIASLLNKNEKKVYIGHVVRHFWEYKILREQIKNGEIGTPAIARLSRCSGFPYGAGEWFGDFKKSGGAALDLSIHDFDWLLWTFGKADRVSARSIIKKELKYIDYVLAIVHFKKGVIAHVEGSWAEAGGFYTSVEVSGSGGIVEYDSRAQSSLLYTPKETGSAAAKTAVIPENPSYSDPYLFQLKHFIDCIKNDKKPLVSADDALESLKLALGAVKSIEQGGEPVVLK